MSLPPRPDHDRARLRGWYDRYRRAEVAVAHGSAVAAAWAATAPLRAMREAYLGYRRYGTGIRGTYGVPAWKQLSHLWWAHARHGVSFDTYYRYQLYLPDRWPSAAGYVNATEAARAYRMLVARSGTDAAELLADKRRFGTWCTAKGLTTIPVLMEFDGGRASGCAEALPETDLFSKWAARMGGVGATRWRYVGGGRYDDGSGRRFTSAELVADLAARSLAGPIVLQPCERSHPALACLTTGALASLRIMTCRPLGGSAQVLVTILKIPTGTAVVDNRQQGGTTSLVDPGSGVLGDGVYTDETRMVTKVVAHHPDTGAPIRGTQVPLWREALALATRAHDLLDDIAFVGWDVAILERGPALLEGNWNGSVKVLQQATGRPLAETPYVRCLADHLEAAYGEVSAEALRRNSEWQPSSRNSPVRASERLGIGASAEPVSATAGLAQP